MNDLPRAGSHIHLIAMCGVGMASLAGLLQARGYRVTGSDQNIYPPMSTYLAEIGIEVLSGFRAEHVSHRPDLVVIGNAVSRDNPEAASRARSKYSLYFFSAGIGQLSDRRANFAGGRRHPWKNDDNRVGRLGVDSRRAGSGFFCRRRAAQFRQRMESRHRRSHVVLEGDEYDTAFFDKGPKFLHYRPQPCDSYQRRVRPRRYLPRSRPREEAFGRLVDIIPADGSLVVCSDYPAALEIAAAAPLRTA